MGIMSLAEIMDRAIDNLKKYIKTILLFGLGYGVIVFISIISVLFLGSFSAALAAGLLPGTVFPAFYITLAVVLIFMAVFTIYLSYNAGIIRIASQEFLKEEVFTHNAIGSAFKSIIRILGIVISGTLLFLPAAGIFTGIGYLIYLGFENTIMIDAYYREKEMALVVISVVVVLIALAAIFAYISLFSFSIHAVVIEKKGVIASVKRSFSLARKSFWRIYGCNVMFYLIVFALDSSFQSFMAAISGIVYLIARLLNISQDYIMFFTTAYSVASWPLSLLSWLVVSPISTIMLTLLYFNQRFRKEGYDIELKLKSIQKSDERKQSIEPDNFIDPSQA